MEFYPNLHGHKISGENETSHCLKSRDIVFVPSWQGRVDTVKNNNVNLMKPRDYLYWNCKQYNDPLNALLFSKIR